MDIDVESTTDVCEWTSTLSLPVMSVCDVDVEIATHVRYVCVNVDVESTTDVCV